MSYKHLTHKERYPINAYRRIKTQKEATLRVKGIFNDTIERRARNQSTLRVKQ